MEMTSTVELGLMRLLIEEQIHTILLRVGYLKRVVAATGIAQNTRPEDTGSGTNPGRTAGDGGRYYEPHS